MASLTSVGCWGRELQSLPPSDPQHGGGAELTGGEVDGWDEDFSFLEGESASPHWYWEMRQCVRRCAVVNPSYEVSWRKLAMSDKDERLIRRLWKAVRGWKLSGSSKWGYVFSGYVRTLTSTQARLFKAVMDWIPDTCEETFIDTLKAISRECLEGVLERGEIWRSIFLDLKVLGGFDTVNNRKSPFDTYKQEYGTEKAGEEDERLKFWIRDTIKRIGVRNVPYSFDEFVSFRDAWALPGASVQGTAKKVVIGVGRTERKIRVKNKWFAMLGDSDYKIAKDCFSGKRVRVRPFVKEDEPAACRTVQCYDTYSLIRCSYIDQGIADLNEGGFWTSVGLGDEKKAEMRRNLASHRDRWKLCTDQSGFDTHQDKRWVVYALRELYAKVASVNGHMAHVIREELDSLDRVDLEWEGNRMEWKKGVLSGYKFTALVDSILNRAETRWMLERMGRSDIHYECYQGDDAVVVLENSIRKDEVASVYAQLGLEVHPEKTWVTRGHTEYLHEIYLDGVVLGFPARAFRSIAWRKPNTNLSFNEYGPDKMKSVLDSFRMCGRRGLNVTPLLRRFMRGVVDGWSEEDFAEWMKTPYIFGGFGAGMGGRKGLDFKVVKRLGVRVSVEGIRHKGELYQKAAEMRARGMVPIPGVRTRSQFVRVRGSSEMPAIKAGLMAAEPAPRVDWVVRDLRDFKDAYARKLILERKLNSRDLITQGDLPSFFGYFLDFDKAYRKYRRMVSDIISIQSTMTAGESYFRYRDWANRVWAGICYNWTRGEASSTARKELCVLVHRTVMLVNESLSRVCV